MKGAFYYSVVFHALSITVSKPHPEPSSCEDSPAFYCLPSCLLLSSCCDVPHCSSPRPLCCTPSPGRLLACFSYSQFPSSAFFTLVFTLLPLSSPVFFSSLPLVLFCSSHLLPLPQPSSFQLKSLSAGTCYYLGTVSQTTNLYFFSKAPPPKPILKISSFTQVPTPACSPSFRPPSSIMKKQKLNLRFFPSFLPFQNDSQFNSCLYSSLRRNIFFTCICSFLDTENSE